MTYKMLSDNYFADGVDFTADEVTNELTFPPHSSEGDMQCISITLLNDILIEFDEDLVVELNSNDPVVTISEATDLAIIIIMDVLDPQGIIQRLHMSNKWHAVIFNNIRTWYSNLFKSMQC